MKQILSVILSLILGLLLSLIGGVKEVHAYGIDYNYVSNVLNEVGYGHWYDDSLAIIPSSYNAYGGFGFSGGMPARYLVSTSRRLNGKNVITPMTETLFTECSYNVEYAKSQIPKKEGMTDEEHRAQAIALLKKMWPAESSQLEIDLTASGNFGYATAFGGSITRESGSNLCFVGLNDSTVSTVTLRADDISNIGEYAFANFSSLKDLSYTLNGDVQIFPYAFCYGCTNLKYLSYPQNRDYVFDKYSFSNCSSLIHWTGLGKNGATNNWDNTTISNSVYTFNDYAFAGCSAITHVNFVSSDVTLSEYAFGRSGLTYIGFFDYHYYDTQDSLLDAYKKYASALMKKNSISDKAFDSVSASRIYVAHREIYDIMNLYQDGLYAGRTLSTANLHIAFDGTDSTSGSMDDTVVRYDDDIYTLNNGFTKEGYSFAGFGSSEMGSGTLADNYNAPHNNTDWIDALACNNGTTTLFPTWTGKSYAITYVLNGGNADNIQLPKAHTYGEPITFLDEPVRYGYDFDGWHEDEALTIMFSGISETDTSEHTYYAKWIPHNITITYNLDGGINHPQNPETIPYDSPRVELNEPTKNGYDFAGWYGDNDEKVTYLLASDGDRIISARWTVASYTIQYELNGGELTGNVPCSYTYGEPTYLVVPPVKDKYRFMGWYSDKALTHRVYQIDDSSYGDITLYAKWSETVAILEIPSKKGYRFIGWVDGSCKKIRNTDLLSAHSGNIYANYLDIRWTTAKKGSKTYVNALKTDYNWYAEKEKKGDKDSFQEQSADGSIVIYGTADGHVTKQDLSLNISGKIKSVSLTRNGKKMSIHPDYFDKKADELYLNGYPITRNGVYVLKVTSATACKTITFMKDNGKPTVTGIARKTIITKTKLNKRVKRTTVHTKKRGKTTTRTKKKGKTKTVTSVTRHSFHITQKRRFYIEDTTVNTGLETTKTKHTATVMWSDSAAGVSTVYINKVPLSAREVKKGKREFKKPGTYEIEVYDYIGNYYCQKIVLDNQNADVTLPGCNMKNNTAYYTGSTLLATDKSGIDRIQIKDKKGFIHTYPSPSYTFKKPGIYHITVFDRAGNYKKLKIKIVKKPKY